MAAAHAHLRSLRNNLSHHHPSDVIEQTAFLTSTAWKGGNRLSNRHRIQWFDDQVRQGKYPNSTQLAQQFEISKRQAQRDIEYLTFSLPAPLHYVAKHRGYCYEDKMYALPHLYMTDEEKKILNIWLTGIVSTTTIMLPS